MKEVVNRIAASIDIMSDFEASKLNLVLSSYLVFVEKTIDPQKIPGSFKNTFEFKKN